MEAHILLVDGPLNVVSFKTYNVLICICVPQKIVAYSRIGQTDEARPYLFKLIMAHH